MMLLPPNYSDIHNSLLAMEYNKKEDNMTKLKISVIVLAIAMLLSVNSFGSDTHSSKAVEESGKVSSHASTSAAHAISGSGQVTSAVSAVPLSIGGAAGAVSTEMAKDLMDAATAPIGTPLKIADESVTAGPPPNEALAPKKPKQ